MVLPRFCADGPTLGQSDHEYKPAGWVYQSLAGMAGRQSVPAAVASSCKCAIPAVLYLHERPGESSSLLHAAVEPELPKTIWRQLAGDCELSGKQDYPSVGRPGDQSVC